MQIKTDLRSIKLVYFLSTRSRTALTRGKRNAERKLWVKISSELKQFARRVQVRRNSITFRFIARGKNGLERPPDAGFRLFEVLWDRQSCLNRKNVRARVYPSFAKEGWLRHQEN